MKLAFLFILMFYSYSYAAGARLTDQQIEELASSQQWRRLLHFSKSLFGDESKVRGEKFFISKQGRQSPQDELKETFDKMTSPDLEERKRYQCQFPARREYLAKYILNFSTFMLPCPALDQWVESLSPDKISVIFASGYLNSAPSSFGHTFLKLQSNKNQQKDLLNYGINFSARTDEQDGVLYAWKGLLGFFPANFTLIQYHLMIKEYVNLEGRDLWEYELNLTANEIRSILYHLLELELGYFDYYFIDENCSSMILQILQIARPDLELISEEEFFVIPIDTLKPIQSIVTNTIYRPSLKTKFYSQWLVLQESQKALVEQFLKGDISIMKSMDVTTLEALQSWISIQESKEPSRWQETSYKLGLERSKREEKTEPVRVTTPKVTPTMSHASSSFALGANIQDKSAKAQVQWMPAFHDRLARFDGLPPYSEIKILNTELLVDKDVQLKNLDVIQVLSNSPVRALEKPISWGFSVGETRYLLAQQSQHLRALGHLGYSFANDQYCLLVAAKAGAQQVISERLQPMVGPSIVAWLILNSRWRINAGIDLLALERDHIFQQQYQMAFDLNSDLWLSLGWQSRSTNEFSHQESEVNLKFFF